MIVSSVLEVFPGDQFLNSLRILVLAPRRVGLGKILGSRLVVLR